VNGSSDKLFQVRNTIQFCHLIEEMQVFELGPELDKVLLKKKYMKVNHKSVKLENWKICYETLNKLFKHNSLKIQLVLFEWN